MCCDDLYNNYLFFLLLLLLLLISMLFVVAREVRSFAMPLLTAACCASPFTSPRFEQGGVTLDSAPSTSQGFDS